MAPRQPLITRRTGTKAETSAVELAQLVKDEIGIAITQEQVLYLLNLKFHLLSSLAHEIHDGIEADAKLGLRLNKEAEVKHGRR